MHGGHGGHKHHAHHDEEKAADQKNSVGTPQ
jgi:hypothetical protein